MNYRFQCSKRAFNHYFARAEFLSIAAALFPAYESEQ
jgi:hypothetical protein